MPILPLALPPQSNQGGEAHGGVAALINCYAIQDGDERKTRMRIRSAAGLESMSALDGASGVRGLLEVDSRVYAVAGRVVSLVDSQGNDTVLGGLESDGHVGMARNQRQTGVQTAICCDGLSYISTSGGPLVAISDADLPASVDVCSVNRSFIFATSDGRMVRSEIDDGFAIDGLDVVQAEASPDGLLRVISRGPDLVAIGQRSTEPWRDTGGEAFGFSRGDALNIGAIGAKSVTKCSVVGQQIADAVAWAATNADGIYSGIAMLTGYTANKISTPWIDSLFESVEDYASIVATSWIERGRGMISWRLTDRTVVYDTSSGLWHERQSRDAAGLPTAWRVSLATGLGSRVLVGDAATANLYWLDPDVEDDAGAEMVMTIRTPPAAGFPGRLEMSALYLDVVPGVGTSSLVDPIMTMRMSRDGETWGAQRSRPLGRQGQRAKRVNWTSLGTFPQATFEFSCSSAVVREVLSASWDGRTLPA